MILGTSLIRKKKVILDGPFSGTTTTPETRKSARDSPKYMDNGCEKTPRTAAIMEIFAAVPDIYSLLS